VLLPRGRVPAPDLGEERRKECYLNRSKAPILFRREGKAGKGEENSANPGSIKEPLVGSSTTQTFLRKGGGGGEELLGGVHGGRVIFIRGKIYQKEREPSCAAHPGGKGYTYSRSNFHESPLKKRGYELRITKKKAFSSPRKREERTGMVSSEAGAGNDQATGGA